MANRLKCLTGLVLVLLFTGHCLAQESTINFSNIGVQNGMTSNWITSLCRDSDGFMWIGTNRGLNRFDGYNIAAFEYDAADSTRLSNNYIACIAEDNDSNLWVGTTFGINLKPLHSQHFQQISLFDHNAYGCNDINNINDIFVARDSTVYIGTREGFFTYRNGRFTHHLIDSTDFSSNINHVFSFAEGQHGEIWMGTFTRELVCYSAETGKLQHFQLPELYQGKYASGLQKLFVDSDLLIWVGSQAGLYVYDLKNERWHQELNLLFFQEIGRKLVTGIQEDQDGTIWISTDGNGIFLFDKKDSQTRNLHAKSGDPKSISTNGLYDLLIDEDNIVWAGTYKQGLDFYRPSFKKFRLFRNEPESDNTLSSNDVNCCLEDSNGNIWIGTNGSGINILNPETSTFKYLTMANSGPHGLASDIIVSLYEDHQKNIWIGTYFGGLNKFSPSTGQFTVYKHDVNNPGSISDDRIWSILEDANNKLWVGTLGGGLNLFDPETESFKRYTQENSTISGDYINHLYLDQERRLWISTTNGLSIYRPADDAFATYTSATSSDGSIQNFEILVSSFQDSRGWHWLCSNNGLIKFNQRNNSSVLIAMKDGLPSNSVYQILEDKLGNLWVSSSRGITKLWFTEIENDSTFTTNLILFDETDGLQGREFSETAALKTSRGELLFGGVNGLNIFNPEEIQLDKTVPKLIFTNLRIFNLKIEAGIPFNNRVILDKPISHTDELVLRYSENLFTIEFAALTYLHPEKNKYKYQLSGFDESWFETDGTANFATFTNLKNGNYTLFVQGANADGTWNEEGIALNIKILPPFWRSWYAFVGYVLLVLSALLVLRKMILFRERLTVELQMEREEARRIHELDMMKLKFFTNISHEFRTPLTLILSPVEKLLPRFKGLPEEKYLGHIYQNSKKLLNMINQLLDFRRMEAQGLSFNPSWGNIIQFITETVSSFNDLSENRNIELRQVTNLREFNMLFDKDKLEKVIFNLLSNAFKFTPVSGLVIVQVTIEESTTSEDTDKRTNLVIRVKDNGVGIRPENMDKIFTRFYQDEKPATTSDNGTGIGLSLAQEYVKLHNGEITVESARNIGTCFSVFLPVDDTINKEAHIYLRKLKETKFKPDQTHKHDTSHGAATKKNLPVILLVEDNHDLRAYLKENLEMNYEILEAEDGKQALELLEKQLPDLILSDVMMPEMDGIELCKTVKRDKITCHIPFVFLTAKISEQQKLEGLKTGADDYIVKPFNFEILETKIYNLIQLKINMRRLFKSKIQIEPNDISITSLDEKFMTKALDIIEQHMGNSNFSVNEFSQLMGISRMQLYNKIMSLTGHTPLEFIRILRMKRAAKLLSESQLNVSEIAYQVGFNDPKYFSIQFKKEFQISPSKYIKAVEL
jgi:signal transduction histidine kinase/ligand-binding sensor domain-containing protein/DNA-binding response OmpR family regulator